MTENVEDAMPAMSQDEALLNDVRQRQADARQPAQIKTTQRR